MCTFTIHSKSNILSVYLQYTYLKRLYRFFFFFIYILENLFQMSFYSYVFSFHFNFSLVVIVCFMLFSGRTTIHNLITALCNPGSIEIRDCAYISAKLQKCTYTYVSLQFTGEMNIRGSKSPTTFILTPIMITGADCWWMKACITWFLIKFYVMALKHFTVCITQSVPFVLLFRFSKLGW